MDQFQEFINEFIELCNNTQSVLASIITGSIANKTADEYSDLDLAIIVDKADYEDFLGNVKKWISSISDPLFFHDFGLNNVFFLIFEDGLEVEIAVGNEANFANLHNGEYITLVDKQQLLEGYNFSPQHIKKEIQVENLKELINSFYHDYSHLMVAIYRDQLWWARGQIDHLRNICIDLLQLKTDFSKETTGFDKIDLKVAQTDLEQLKPTYCLSDKNQIKKASDHLFSMYKSLAISLSDQYKLDYPHDLEVSIKSKFA